MFSFMFMEILILPHPANHHVVSKITFYTFYLTLNNYPVRLIIIPITQMRKLRFGAMQRLV